MPTTHSDLRSTEAKINVLLEAGIVDERVIEELLPAGNQLNYESDIWDYKTGFAKPIAMQEFSEYDICSVLKDVAAFYNSFGGYLLFLLPEREKRSKTLSHLVDAEVLTSKFKSYTGHNIRLKMYVRDKLVGDRTLELSLLHVPRRSNYEPPLSFRRASALSKTGKSAFSEGDIYCRENYECVPVQDSLERMRFLIGSRRYLHDGITNPASTLDHNLPAEDPNLIKFIGRNRYLFELWCWLRDLRHPVRVLTGMGGLGKTAIAHEFCRQVVKSESEHFDKLIWLTAKSQTFSPVLGKMVPTTRTDFTNVDDLLDAVLAELASENDAISALDRDEKCDTALDALTQFRILCVVDDVDALPPQEQVELFSTVNNIFNQATGRGGRSRVLLTSRLDLSAGPKQTIMLKGFTQQEAESYIESLLGFMEADDALKKQAQRHQNKLVDISRGSPIFIASVLRLAQHGYSIPDALNRWKESAGEDVRRFAFSKEISELDYQSSRVLYVVQTLGRSTVDEIAEIIESGQNTVLDALGRLRQYHLYSSKSDPVAGTTIQAPEPVRLTVDITKQRIQEDDIRRLDKLLSRLAGRKNKKRDPIEERIGNINRLWKSKAFDAATIAASSAVKEFPKSGDLSYMLGRCYLNGNPAMLDLADSSFKEAHLKNCDRADFVGHWIRAKAGLRDWKGVLEITSGQKDDAEGYVAYMRLWAMGELAKAMIGRGEIGPGAEQMKIAISEARPIIDDARSADMAFEIRDLILDLANSFFLASVRSSGRKYDEHIGVFDAARFCIDSRVGNNQMFLTGLRYLESWWTNVVKRIDEKDLNAAVRLERRLSYLKKIASSRDGVVGRGATTKKTLADAIDRLAKNLDDYRKK